MGRARRFAGENLASRCFPFGIFKRQRIHESPCFEINSRHLLTDSVLSRSRDARFVAGSDWEKARRAGESIEVFLAQWKEKG